MPATRRTSPPNTITELSLYLDPAGQYPCRLRSNAVKTRRDAREAEGAPLLREYRVKSLIEGSNPSLSARYAKRPERGVLRIWRRERCGRTLPGSTNSPGANLDSRRLAPQRVARRGWAHGWAQQSPQTSRNDMATEAGAFVHPAEEAEPAVPAIFTSFGQQSIRNVRRCRLITRLGTPHRPFRFRSENTISSLDARLVDGHRKMSRRYRGFTPSCVGSAGALRRRRPD